jgi:hypothetical protein
MSSDTDGMCNTPAGIPVKVHYVRILTWRAEAISAYMQTIDDNEDAPYVKTKHEGDSKKRIRDPELVRVAKGEDRAVTKKFKLPTGKPRAVYSEDWLTGLEDIEPEFVELSLEISKEAFELLNYVA